MLVRVGLIVLAIVIGLVLREFGVPRAVGLVIGLVPWAIAEKKGLIPGPYEKSARDVMFEDSDKKG